MIFLFPRWDIYFFNVCFSCLAGSYVASSQFNQPRKLWVSNFDELGPLVTLSTTSLLPVSGTAVRAVIGTASTVAWLEWGSLCLKTQTNHQNLGSFSLFDIHATSPWDHIPNSTLLGSASGSSSDSPEKALQGSNSLANNVLGEAITILWHAALCIGWFGIHFDPLSCILVGKKSRPCHFSVGKKKNTRNVARLRLSQIFIDPGLGPKMQIDRARAVKQKNVFIMDGL